MPKKLTIPDIPKIRATEFNFEGVPHVLLRQAEYEKLTDHVMVVHALVAQADPDNKIYSLEFDDDGNIISKTLVEDREKDSE